MRNVALAPAHAVSWAVGALDASDDAQLADVADAEVLIWLDPSDPAGLVRALEKGRGIKWFQLSYAGVESFVAAGVMDPSRIWHFAKGVYVGPVAEQALASAADGAPVPGMSS